MTEHLALATRLAVLASGAATPMPMPMPMPMPRATCL